MKRYLMNFDCNWADEMDISGICVLKDSEVEKFKQCAKTATGEFCIGTNEEIPFEEEEEILGCVDFTPITDEEFKVLKKLNLLELGFAGQFYEWVIENA